jgi:hypothetical protein
MVTLKVFVEEDCWSCSESRRIVEELATQFPEVAIELVNLTPHNRPSDIFAVPTYKLNGKIISLGNPYLRDLRRKIQDALNAMGT